MLMRITSTLLSLTVAAGIAVAAPQEVKVGEFGRNARNTTAVGIEQFSNAQRARILGATVNGRAVMGKNLDKASTLRVPAKSKAATSAPEVIVDTPEGTPYIYARKGDGFMVFYGYVFPHEQNGQALNAVFAADGKTVYIQDPISSAIAYTWVKGTLDGTKITVPVGQYIMNNEEEGYGAVVYAGKLTETEEGLSYEIDKTITEITYNIGADGVISLEDKFTTTDDYPDYVVTAFWDDDEGWSGYADYNSSYSPFTDTMSTLPEGAPAPSDWLMTSTDYENGGTKKTFVSVSVDGDKMYIGNLLDELSDSYVTGTIADGKVTFPSNQYLGISNIAYFTYFVGGEYTIETISDPDFGDYEEIVNVAKEGITMDYDAEARTLTAAEGKAFYANAGKADVATGEGVSGFASYYDPSLKYFVEVPAIPATPVITGYGDYFDDYGYIGISMEIPTVSTEGEDLNVNNLYYQIYTRVGDEIEPFVFYSDEYTGLEEFGLDELSEVPYTMVLLDAYGDTDIKFGGESVFFYTTLADAYGVKSIYKACGETHESPIFWFDINGTTGIDEALAKGQAAVTAVYGVDGVRRNGLTRGINIVRMNDGSVRKMFVR